MAAIQTDPQYKLRLPADLKLRIEAAARENNRSMNAEIIQRLEYSFDAPKIRNMDTGVSRSISDEEYKRYVRAIVEMNKTDVDALRAEIRALRFQLVGSQSAELSESTD